MNVEINRYKPSCVGLAFQSVRCRTKSKKKSPSGTLITEKLIPKRMWHDDLITLILFPLWSEMWKSFHYIHMETMNFLFCLTTNPILPLSAILTNRLKPSEELSINLLAILWQKFFALELDSTSNAYKIIDSFTQLLFILEETFSK